MKKFSLFCALALFGSTAFALDKAGCASLKDVKILNSDMKDAVWERQRHRRGFAWCAWGVAWKGRSAKEHAGKEFLVCAYPKVATYVGGDTSKASSFVCK